MVMVAPVAFSGQATGQHTCSKTVVEVLRSLPVKTCKFRSNDVNTLRLQICKRARTWKQIHTRSGAWNKPWTDLRLKAVSSSDIISNPPSPSDTIKRFYTCINKKDMDQLGVFIAEDCVFDDYSFSKPFQQKKEVMDFFRQLTDSMGPNIEFKIDLISEGDDFTTAVNWHLEWNKKQIPFTRGCSLYECSVEGTKLVIKKAQVVIESPLKPGHSALILLKMVTSLFDAFPKPAFWFLENFHAVIQVILKIYILVLPFISPLLAWYINIWKIMYRLLTKTLKILVLISKLFYK